MKGHRIRGMAKIKEIRLKDPSNKDLMIKLSSNLMNQIDKLLKMKEIIDSSANNQKISFSDTNFESNFGFLNDDLNEIYTEDDLLWSSVDINRDN